MFCLIWYNLVNFCHNTRFFRITRQSELESPRSIPYCGSSPRLQNCHVLKILNELSKSIFSLHFPSNPISYPVLNSLRTRNVFYQDCILVLFSSLSLYLVGHCSLHSEIDLCFLTKCKIYCSFNSWFLFYIVFQFQTAWRFVFVFVFFLYLH